MIPIAVVGIGCRFPGGADDPQKLWKLVMNGEDAWTDTPPDRFNWKSFHHPNIDMQGMHNHRGGHFLKQDVSAFDAKFFGIPPFEAESMDPQQRLLLMTAYEALENAGLPIETLRGSNTGVYVASFTHDYEQLLQKDLLNIPKYFLTGVGSAIFSNRISYVFDFKGPSITVDTACSGSLVAIHQACQSLRIGECDMALAGGTNLLLSADLMMGMSLLQIVNSDGKSYAFDSRGSGYGRGEGAAIIALKRLDDALEAGDHIHAVIRGTGVNQDGKTSGITVPSGEAQGNLIRSVYKSACLDPKDTIFFEAHGTGTVAGDTAEVHAIGRVFCEGGAADRETPLYLNSIKANIGHTEGCSGVAGLIKAILTLKNGIIPPVINIKELKENMLLPHWNMKIPQEILPWPNGKLRRASVNSFGYGGTNAHAIVEVPTSPEELKLLLEVHSIGVSNGHKGVHVNGNSHGLCTATSNGHVEDPVNHVNAVVNETINTNLNDLEKQEIYVFPITARAESSVSHAAEALGEWLQKKNTSMQDLENLAYSLTTRRSVMPWRHAALASSFEQLAEALTDPARQSERISNKKSLVFVFTGQGAQWYGMGRELLKTSTVFLMSIKESSKVLQTFPDASWNLVDELLKDKFSSRVNESQIGQPASTAIQIALVDLTKSLGLKPDSVVGHSSGEIAAAYAVGAINRFSALKISYYRGLLSRRSAEIMNVPGGMLAVGLGEEETEPFLSQIKSGKVVIACQNSPSSTTVSGDCQAIIELKELLDKEGVWARSLAVDTAYHSHHMESVAALYLKNLGGITTGAPDPTIQYISSVTGARKHSGFGPEYWVENLVSKVCFCDAITKLCHSETNSSTLLVFLELGPHHALVGPTRQTATAVSQSLSQLKFLCLPTLTREHNAIRSFLESGAKLFQLGYSINLASANSLGNKPKSYNVVGDLPPYKWDLSSTYWHESRLSSDHRFRHHAYHELLGIRMLGTPSSEPSWRHVMSVDSLPWLLDHAVDGVPVFPATGYISMVIEAKKQITLERHPNDRIANFNLKDVVFIKALLIPESPASVELVLSFKGERGAKESSRRLWEEFRISSFSEDKTWNEHCHGFIIAELEEDIDAYRQQEDTYAQSSQLERFVQLQGDTMQSTEPEKLYEDMKSRGNYYGPTFALIEKYATLENQASGSVTIPDVAEVMPAKYMQSVVIHPGLLDAITHTVLPLFYKLSKASSVFTVGIADLTISTKLTSVPGTRLYFTTGAALTGPTSAKLDFSVFQENEKSEMEMVIRANAGELRGLSERRTDNSEFMSQGGPAYSVQWDLDLDIYNPSNSTIFKAEQILDDIYSPGELINKLNRGSAIYIREALQKVSSADVHPSQREYYRWMKGFDSSGTAAEIWNDLSNSVTEEVLKELPALGVEGESLDLIGHHLSRILTGEVDPVTLMMQDGLLSRGYGDVAVSRCYAHLLKFVKQLVFKNPRMKILEVGAGTGGASFPVLEGLDKDGELPLETYDFTDVSAGFFEMVRPRMTKWESSISFKILDLGRDPVEQGFQEKYYDVILASNAIHVTSKLDDSIATARRLLKPGGWLLLVEVTQVHPFLNAICGITPGWYCGIEDDRRDSPTISLEEWKIRLTRGSFSQGITYFANDCEGKDRRYSFMASQSLESANDNPFPVSILTLKDTSSQNSSLAKHLQEVLRNRGYQVSITHFPLESVSTKVLFLVLDEMESPLLWKHAHSSFEDAKKILLQAQNVLWISVAHTEIGAQNPENGILAGFIRTAREENINLKAVTITTHLRTEAHRTEVVNNIADVATISFLRRREERSDEREFAFRDGKVLIPRLTPNKTLETRIRDTLNPQEPFMGPVHQPGRPLALHVETPGLLDSLVFVDDEVQKQPLLPHQIDIKVSAFGVNFKDLIIMLGQMKPGVPMAGECAGIVTAIGDDFKDHFKIGDRVCAWIGTEYSSHTRVHGLNTCKLPDSMSFEVGASIATAFCTAYEGLVQIAHLEKGQSVLIHAAAGGVGQAAIKIAQYIGAEIFATVGSKAKREFLIEHFGIPEDHIFSSRNVEFKTGIMRMTNGAGVTAVLNSLSGEMLRDSLDCVSRFGYFLEIGKADMYAKKQISLEAFDNSITVASIDLWLLSLYRPAYSHMVMGKVMELLTTGELTPVTLNVMSLSDLESSLRSLQAGKLLGKIVLTLDNETLVKVRPPLPPAPQLNPDGTYLIAGGMGGLGLALSRWMTSRGARHIVLLSRKEPDAKEKAKVEKEFGSIGVQIRVAVCDIVDENQCQRLKELDLFDAPPVRGIIQAAAVTRDITLEDMTLDDYLQVLNPKVRGTRNLMRVFDTPMLDFVIMLSSTASVLGSRGSANYAAGNSFLDYVANLPRTSSHAHVMSVNLGPMKEVGIVARDFRLERLFKSQGLIPLKNEEFFILMDYAIGPDSRQENCTQIVTSFTRGSIESASNTNILNNPLLHLLPHRKDQNAGNPKHDQSQDIKQLLSKAQKKEDIIELISAHLTKKISTLAAMDKESFTEDVTLENLGMDSLVVIELKNWIAREMLVTLQPSEIMGAYNLQGLVNLIFDRSSLVQSRGQNEEFNKAQPEHPVSDSIVDTEKVNGSDGEEVRKEDTVDPIPSTELPRQPIPDMEDMLQSFLTAAACISTPEELEKTKQCVQEFMESNSPGRQLHDRLVKFASDPTTDNWFSDILVKKVFLSNRTTLVPFQNYFGTHPVTDGVQPTAAERAATVSLAAIKCKKSLEAGQITADVLAEKTLDMNSYNGLFNVYREPYQGQDRIRKFDGYNHIVVFKNGLAFKVPMEEVTWDSLKATFEEIIQAAHGDESGIPALTMDQRDNWAEMRTYFRRFHPANAKFLETIETAAFTVSLDDDKPISQSERAYQIFWGNGKNRWHDKSLQFVVCMNGASGNVMEHALLDGTSTNPLKPFLIEGVKEEQEFIAHQKDGQKWVTAGPMERLPVVTDLVIDGRVSAIQSDFESRISLYTFKGFTLSSVSESFFRRAKIAPKAGVQLAIQLASQRFFGYHPSSVETVSLTHYHHGRSAVTQTLWPAVVDFCGSYNDPNATEDERRELFTTAAATLTHRLANAFQSGAFFRYMLALQGLLDDRDQVPSLFNDDVYKRSQRPILTTDCLDTDVFESGIVLEPPGSVWIHYQVLKESVVFSIWGHDVDMPEFTKQLDVAIMDIKTLLRE